MNYGESYIDKMRSLLQIREQMRRYFTACRSMRTKEVNVERAISEFLLPAMQTMLIEAITESNRGTLKKGISNDAPILEYEGLVFGNYQAIYPKYILGQQLLSSVRNYDIYAEGTTMIKMSFDLKNLPYHDFANKYAYLLDLVNCDVLIDNACDTFKKENFQYEEYGNDTFVAQYNLEKNNMEHLVNFFHENSDVYSTVFKNGHIYLRNKEISNERIVARGQIDNNGDYNIANITFEMEAVDSNGCEHTKSYPMKNIPDIVRGRFSNIIKENAFEISPKEIFETIPAKAEENKRSIIYYER